MARDRRAAGRRPRAEDETVEFNPVDQLNDWRTWRTGDSDLSHTVEFPAVTDGTVHEPSPGRVEELEPAGRPRRRWSGRRPGAGILVGGGLVVAALLLSGLAAAGVGPVRDLIGSAHDPSSTNRSGNPTGSTGRSDTDGSRTRHGSRAATGGAASTATPAAPSGAATPQAPAAGRGGAPAGPAGRQPAQPGQGQPGQGQPGQGQPGQGQPGQDGPGAGAAQAPTGP